MDLGSGDDYAFHISRLEALIRSFEDGTFPSYIDRDAIYGYGYLVKPFYSDFVLIPFGIIGYPVNIEFAYRFFLFSMTVVCGVCMYKFVYKLSNSFYASSISGLLYTFSLYRLFDVYCRAAIGEVISFTFIPLVFLGLYYAIYGDFKRKWYVLPIGFSLVIMSHVISSVLLFITVVIICLFYYKKFVGEPKRFYFLILSGIVTLIMVSYYLLPFLEQTLADKFYFHEKGLTASDVDLFRLDVIEILKSMTDGFTNRLGVGPKLGFLLILPLFLRFF
jgi:uncharacterized membrane protein